MNYRWTGQMHHTRLQAQRSTGSMERPVHHRIRARMDDSPYTTACAGKASKTPTLLAQ